MMNIRHKEKRGASGLKTLAGALFLPAILCQPAAAAKKPNVVFIISDDQGEETLHSLGGQVLTPRLDRMREEGLYLSNFYVTSTVCSPSRYSFLTGRYAGNCRSDGFMRLHPSGEMTRVENNCELEPDRRHLAEVLQKNGYKTGFVGKSHLVNHNWANRPKNWELYGLRPYPQDAEPRDPEISAKLKHNHEAWCEAIKAYGFDYVDGVYGANPRELYCKALWGHNLEWTVSKALTFLEESKDEPFFLYFATTLQHGPDPRLPKFGLGMDPRITPEGFLEDAEFDFMPSRKSVLDRYAAAGLPKDGQPNALWLDDGVGAILDKIRDLGLEEDTIVIFVPDHGFYQPTLGKATLYDDGMKVPMFIQWKGTIQPGATYNRLLANIDVAPTIMDLCGITPPEDYDLDGKSFKPALFGSQEPLREYVFSELGYARAVRSEKWKYIAVRYPEEIEWMARTGVPFPNFPGNPSPERPYLIRNTHLGHIAADRNPNYFDPDQLYNIQSDPEESDNVFGQYPEVEAQMKKVLEQKLEAFPGRPFGEFASSVLPAVSGEPAARAVLRSAASDSSEVTSVSIEGRSGWQTRAQKKKPSYFYLTVDNPDLRNGAQAHVLLRVTYLDRGNAKVLVQYDSSDPSGNPDANLPPGVFKHMGSFYTLDSGTWKTKEFLVRDARFAGRCHGADIRFGFMKPDADPVIGDIEIYRVD
ncbi:sulfatase family protein [Tichowtungia aerotolerans]|uniref:Sulfatase-like hydrolase/transferase n=1 Tax=Tichowtungia aerotolerans TaxID=2697043 RepID=A0A6P1M550_9BACT|nr:sulfatase-like hydrolase/transferase [Tichowtungia aerotolerans]QHI69710.1 sulfatase-like hydrolase/transferase [Tichowtungia aerotolerans]